VPVHDADLTPQLPNGKGILRTGSYLHASCPVCRGDMIDGQWIQFLVAGVDGSQGLLQLSPRFNVFDKQASIPIETGEELRDLQCPRCRASLIDADLHCGRCGARAVKLHVVSARLELTLFICSRMGCPWHGITEEDRRRLVLENGS